MAPPQRVARSYLYVPADGAARLAAAGSRGADAVIADLEDSVAPGQKDSARQNARDWLFSEPHDDEQRWVRVNAGASGLDDVLAMLERDSVSGRQPTIAGVCLPKVESSAEIRGVSALLESAERRWQLAAGSILIMPLIESAAGVQALREIAESPRVQKLQLGELDLAADLALLPDDNETELLPLRLSVVVASAAAGIAAPVGAVSADFRDLARFEVSTARLKRAGYFGRAAIHPAQLETIHTVFGVSPAALQAARAVVAFYENAVANGSGAIAGADGRMIDEAVVRQSRHIIDVAALELKRNET